MRALSSSLLTRLTYPYHYARIALRWRKSRKRGGGLHLRVRNFDSLAKALNRNRIPYVLLRGFPSASRLRANDSQEDFDLLVSAHSIQQLLELGALMSGRVPVDIYFDLRPSVRGYHYYPPELAERILAARTAHADSYSIPDILLRFLSLSYHVVYQKGMDDKLDHPLEQTVMRSKHYATLQKLGDNPAVQFPGPYTLLSLHEFMKLHQFNMPFDLLRKWPLQHPLLDLIYQLERKKLQASRWNGFPLTFTVRSDAGEPIEDGAARVAEFIAHELEVERIVKLNEEQVGNLSIGTRGGNWVERQRKQYHHVPPTHLILCQFRDSGQLDRFCRERLPEFKKMVRVMTNRLHPFPDGKQRYVLHGADDQWESLDCLRLIGLLRSFPAGYEHERKTK